MEQGIKRTQRDYSLAFKLSVPRSLAAAVAPTLAGSLFGLGWLGAPLVACGALKIAYDLSLLAAFRHVKPDERTKP